MTSDTETKENEMRPELQIGDIVNGFRVSRIAALEEIKGLFYELEHRKTGARYIHIRRDDVENAFGVALKTIPTDSTGVAHILEHTALCGSEKFPVRDPFFSMIKRSLNTFMNAFTASDWTMYPFATSNRKDFFNLMDVYLDAVFHPNLTELSFKQEGHRLDTEGDDLVYKGVVYNEMKGAMSSPSQVLGRSMMAALLPDTTYANNSGGEPSDIPHLTHAQLVAFHRRHYHPSNAFFFSYGDISPKESLAFVEEKILRHFDRIDPKTEVAPQPRWAEPRTVTRGYDLAPTENPAKKSQVAVAWLTPDIRDAFSVLSMSLLSEILLGNPASPLRRALIESGIGKALADHTGFEGDIRDTYFSCGLKDVDESDAPAIEKLIFDTLQRVVDEGIDAELIEAAIHQVEFHRKEITNTPYPYGLKLVMGILGTWIHEGDPLRVLRFDDDLQTIRAEAEKGPFFENLIRRYFLDNPHRVLFKLVPDQTLSEKEAERTRKELTEKREILGPADIEKIRQDAEALQRLQETEEDASVLPTLELSDISPSVPSILPAEPRGETTVDVTWFDQPTSGILYFTAAAGLGTMPERLLPMVPFFCHAFDKVGTEKRDYVEIARAIDLYTGGVGMGANVRTQYDEAGASLPFVTIGGKCLERNQEKMFDLLTELVHEMAFRDRQRLKNLLLEYRASLESSVVQNGHGLAISLAARNFSQARHLSEIWKGVDQIKRFKSLTDDLSDAVLDTVIADLTEIGERLFSRNNMRVALVGDDDLLSRAVASVQRLASGLPDGGADGFMPPDVVVPDGPVREGWSTSTAVSFVARAFETVRMLHPDAPALAVIGKMLRSLFLHREIREKGGAYGGFSIYNAEDGLFCLGSYRDPHIVNTLRVYDAARGFITAGSYTDEDVKEAVLQVCSEIDRPEPPGAAARKAFYRKLIGLTDETRKAFKEGLLGLNRDAVIAAAKRYFGEDREYGEAVISSETLLKAANARLGDSALEIFRI